MTVQSLRLVKQTVKAPDGKRKSFSVEIFDSLQQLGGTKEEVLARLQQEGTALWDTQAPTLELLEQAWDTAGKGVLPSQVHTGSILLVILPARPCGGTPRAQHGALLQERAS